MGNPCYGLKNSLLFLQGNLGLVGRKCLENHGLILVRVVWFLVKMPVFCNNSLFFPVFYCRSMCFSRFCAVKINRFLHVFLLSFWQRVLLNECLARLYKGRTGAIAPFFIVACQCCVAIQYVKDNQDFFMKSVNHFCDTAVLQLLMKIMQ